MTTRRTAAQLLKFELLARGMTVTDPCATVLAELNDDRPMTPADYASTTGLILRLEDEVWVNAPISAHNPNFVHTPPFTLDVDAAGFHVSGSGLSSRASVWLPPEYHGQASPSGRPWNHFAFTHGDRVRLSPIRGCAMTCKFCNIPYEDPYDTKPMGLMLDAVRVALEDPIQPARHVLISGGTPRAGDVGYLQELYRQVLRTFPTIDVDIMMVPVDGLFDLPELRDLGVHELSINIEVHDPDRARTLMPNKYRQGLDHYLRFIAEATAVLGPGRVRSMLMVGLESEAQTLAGVQAVLDVGGIPVLSPFRPDPATPLRDHPLLSATELDQVYAAAAELAKQAGSALGPECPPCTHNTLAFVDPDLLAGPQGWLASPAMAR